MSRLVGTRTFLAAALAALVAPFLVVAPASGMSPAVNRTWYDKYPGQATDTAHDGIVVEGRGLGPTCGTSTQRADSTGYLAVAQMAVTYLNLNKATLVEISPQPGCHTISQYETLIGQIASYIEAHAPSYTTWWGGFQYNEEDGFGYDSVSLATLNHYSFTLTSGIPGPAASILQGFSGDHVWSQTTWNYILDAMISGGDPNNTWTAGLMTGDGGPNLTSWDTTQPAPFNMQSYIDGSIHTAPYSNQYGSTAGYNLYWDEHFN